MSRRRFYISGLFNIRLQQINLYSSSFPSQIYSGYISEIGTLNDKPLSDYLDLYGFLYLGTDPSFTGTGNTTYLSLNSVYRTTGILSTESMISILNLDGWRMDLRCDRIEGFEYQVGSQEYAVYTFIVTEDTYAEYNTDIEDINNDCSIWRFNNIYSDIVNYIS